MSAECAEYNDRPKFKNELRLAERAYIIRFASLPVICNATNKHSNEVCSVFRYVIQSRSFLAGLSAMAH